jgi:hypothetical protein
MNAIQTQQQRSSTIVRDLVAPFFCELLVDTTTARHHRRQSTMRKKKKKKKTLVNSLKKKTQSTIRSTFVTTHASRT